MKVMIVICAKHLYVICYHHSTFQFSNAWSIFLWNTYWDIFRPTGILRNPNLPHGVLKVVRYEDSSSSRTFRNPCCASSLVNLVVPFSCGKISSVYRTGWYLHLINLLRSFGSRQILNLPSGFSLTTCEFTKLVGPSTHVIIPCSTRDSNSFFSLGCKARATFLAWWTTGFAFYSMLIWYL